MQIVEALIVGMLFSIILIKTTNFEIREEDIYMKRSKAFRFHLTRTSYYPSCWEIDPK